MLTDSNSEKNSSLQGRTSFFIGVYLIIGTYAIKSMLAQFLVDDSPFMFLSPQLIEIFIIFIAFLVLFFSSLAIYFSKKRLAKKTNRSFWNTETKKEFWIYIAFFSLLFLVLYYLNTIGFINTMVPVFLFSYGLIFYFFNQLEDKNNLIILGVSFFLALLTLITPSYWSAALYLLGIAHVFYGVLKISA